MKPTQVKTVKLNFQYDDIHWWRNPKDGCWNASVKVNGIRVRVRSAVLVIKDGKQKSKK